MITLDTVNKSLEVLLGGVVATSQLPITASFADVTTTTYIPQSNDNITNNTTAITIVSAPVALTQRQVKLLTIYNADTASATVIIRLNNSGVFRILVSIALLSGYTLVYSAEGDFYVITSTGSILGIGTPGSPGAAGISGVLLHPPYPPIDGLDGEDGYFLFGSPSSGGSGAWTVITNTDTGAQNNWAPTGLSGNTLIEWNGASDIAISGIAGGVTGQMIRFKNITTTKIGTFADTSGSSSASNQFKNLVTSAATPVAAKGEITYQYDGTNWKIIDHDQGIWISQPYVSGDFTASSGTWTVDSGDIQIFKYKLDGTTLFVSWAIGTTSVSATPATLQIKIPGGFSAVAAGAQSGPQFYHESAGAAYIFGETWISPSSLTLIQLYPTGFGSGTLWIISTNNTATYATMPIEVS